MFTNTLSHLIRGIFVNALRTGVLVGACFAALEELRALLTHSIHLDFIFLADQLLAGAVAVDAVETNTLVDFVGGFVVDTFGTHS